MRQPVDEGMRVRSQRLFCSRLPSMPDGGSRRCSDKWCLHHREGLSLKGARSMHPFAHHRPNRASEGEALETKGLIASGGWRYDLMEWFIDTFVFRGQVRQLRHRTATLARMQPGDQVLDVGCGTGTLAMEVARRVGHTGRVAGVDPGTEQITCARRKAARRNVPIDFQIGVIEHLPFSDQTFDVVLSTLMMHHLQ
ncbi:MAG: class I SAM-dependent methyltransferase, partial [Chloroflexi bacterium]